MSISLSPNARTYALAHARPAPTLVDRLSYLTQDLPSDRIFTDAKTAVRTAIDSLDCPSSFFGSQLYHCLKVGLNTYVDTLGLVIRLRDSQALKFRNLPGYFFHTLKSAERYNPNLKGVKYRFLPQYIAEHFYDPSIFIEIEAAVDEALLNTTGTEAYRDRWIAVCLQIGLNRFQDRVDEARSRARQGEIRQTAGFLFHQVVKDLYSPYLR